MDGCEQRKGRLAMAMVECEVEQEGLDHDRLYLKYIQDLLAPEKINIPIVEDPKTGEVTLPGAVVVKIRDLDHIFQLLQTDEANRHATNTKMNTESSCSHAILMFLAKENGRLEIKMKGILDELKCLKDHNDFISNTSSSSRSKVLADATKMYEKKIAELMKQLEKQQAHSESAEEQLDVMKKLLSDH
ncbi:Kinesin-like protein KIN-UA [Camellia lanceoleosa]|uniref:Kinesin-like protein KIN-UA n=1 Tax=Camellia lanceoleosa TaxID=1840588 RepID=A0ACC0FQF7_9ERIC|nr:Kinesin-like protein KIN-UA [Camellia lanceoleosa]